MKKSESSELEDRISELPDALKLHILELLPTVDAIRTTILSNRWKNLWTTIPCLSFFSSANDNLDKVRDFINGAVKFWRGIKIFQFKVYLYLKLDESVVSDIDPWVRFATENEVEELDLHLGYAEKYLYWVPQCLFSCSSLKKLRLKRCNFRIEGDVQWNQLTSLMIDSVCLNEDVVTQMLSACPRLEVLELTVYDDDGLSICSSSLKMLMIHRIVRYADQPMYSELRICSPNLESLDLLGGPYDKYLLKNVPSVTRAYLGFFYPLYSEYHHFVTWHDSLEEGLSEILSAIQHVEQVTLSHLCIKVLVAAKEKHMLAPYPNVKILQLNSDCHKGYEQILGLLEIFPELQKLVLRLKEDDRPICANHVPKFKTNLPKSFLLQLRTLEVSWTKGHTSLFPLVEFLLRYASRLEKVVFRRKMNQSTFEREVFSFCITGAVDEHAKILTKLQS